MKRRQTMVTKAIHRIPNIEQQEPPLKSGDNSGIPEVKYHFHHHPW